MVREAVHSLAADVVPATPLEPGAGSGIEHKVEHFAEVAVRFEPALSLGPNGYLRLGDIIYGDGLIVFLPPVISEFLGHFGLWSPLPGFGVGKGAPGCARAGEIRETVAIIAGEFCCSVEDALMFIGWRRVGY
jgi:hypothetical protein